MGVASATLSITFAVALPSYGIFQGYAGGAWQGICPSKNALGISMGLSAHPGLFHYLLQPESQDTLWRADTVSHLQEPVTRGLDRYRRHDRICRVPESHPAGARARGRAPATDIRHRGSSTGRTGSPFLADVGHQNGQRRFHDWTHGHLSRGLAFDHEATLVRLRLWRLLVSRQHGVAACGPRPRLAKHWLLGKRHSGTGATNRVHRRCPGLDDDRQSSGPGGTAGAFQSLFPTGRLVSLPSSFSRR